MNSFCGIEFGDDSVSRLKAARTIEAAIESGVLEGVHPSEVYRATGYIPQSALGDRIPVPPIPVPTTKTKNELWRRNVVRYQ